MVQYKDGKGVSVQFQLTGDSGETAIYVVGEKHNPVLGSLAGEDLEFTFRPAIPFSPGQEYIIRQGGEVVGSFRVRSNENSSAPKVLAIYPTKDSVPENLLKMYVRFSQPMQRVGRALDYIRVTDLGKGEEVPVFLDMEAELWNREHTLLTLWLDPGRIKTGLIPNQQQGLPLQAGKKYTLDISGQWRGANGQPLSAPCSKTFYVAEADREKLQVTSWELDVPKSGSRDTLRIFFQEPMDAILSLETIAVYTSDQGMVKGSSVLRQQEQALMFVPLNTWKKGKYTIKVQSILEDIAGNRLDRLFDNALQPELQNNDDTTEFTRSFSIFN